MHRRCLIAIVGWVAGLGLPGTAGAQSFDCAKASTPIERAVCASPGLRDQDRALADAYAQALARDMAGADALRQAQRTWLRGRQSCLPANGVRGNEAQACLSRLYAARLAQLSPPAPAVAAAAPASPVALPPALPVPPTVPPVAPIPAASPPPASPPRPVPPAPHAAQAGFDRTEVPAAGRTDAILRVAIPGRFALRARSATGVAIQLVDMLSGPGEPDGEPGHTDGRLDVLLDAGTYKLRVSGADGASGTARLTAEPFTDAAPPQAAPLPGETVSATLADLQQWQFWLAVGPDGRVRVEAAGRSLADLRLWRDGRDLVDLAPRTRIAEPVPAHPLSSIVLEGVTEPGTYLAVAYGGPARSWTDGSTEQTFLFRTGVSAVLADGAASGQVGPFGSEVFAVPAWARRLRLLLPASAPAELQLWQDGEAGNRGALQRQSREPALLLPVPPPGHDAPPALVELRGAAGQDYALRGFANDAGTVSRPGYHWLAVQAIGQGGDEAPPGFVLLRSRGRVAEVIAGEGPQVGPGQAWRGRFNLRGPASLLFQVGAPAAITVQTAGPGVDASIATFDRQPLLARGDGRDPGGWLLEAGWYELRLAPRDGAVGVIDLTLGPPGLVPPAPSPGVPDSPVFPLGLRNVGVGETLTLRANPGTALIDRPAPVDLASGALVVTQRVGEALDIPVQVPRTGSLAGRAIGGSPVAAELRDPHPAGDTVLATLHLPGTDRGRTVSLAWHAPPPDPPALRPAADALPPLAAGTPRFLDLGRDAQRSFALTVPEGGLFRVETLGRLQTAGTLGTAFQPVLETAEANGPGQNMVIQRFLRAGRYRVGVQAKDSAGRLGIVARPAPLLAGATLLPGESVRAALPAGSGAVFPIEVTEAGLYHLELMGLRADLVARLEDAEGWPLLAAGPLTTLDQELTPGRYRLVVSPGAVGGRAVARLARVLPPTPILGHGPHPLPFEAPRTAEWREPPGRDDPRTPDDWRFAVPGPSDVVLTVSDGMVAELRRQDAPDGAPLARLVGPADYTGRLEAGAYQVAASSLGRNDRLGYTLGLRSTQLQPGVPRRVTLPARLPFSLGEPGVAGLTSWGKVPLKAVLRGADGRAIAQADGRVADWNIALSRVLPAGEYVLELSALEPKGTGSAVQGEDAPVRQVRGAASDDDSDDQPGNDDAPRPNRTQDSADSGRSDAADDGSDDDKAPRVEVSLALPAPRPPLDASGGGALVLQGGGVQRMALPAPGMDGLLVAAASAAAELVMSVERQDASGAWVPVGQDQGLAPLVAVPGAPGAGWRATVWPVDGGQVPIRFAASTVRTTPQPVGRVALAAVPLDGIDVAVRAALAEIPGAGLVGIEGDAAGVLGGSVPGQAVSPPEDGVLAPQAGRLWLLSRAGAETLALRLVTAEPGAVLAVSVPAGGSARVPSPAVPSGRMRAWLAESGLGQPGVAAGRGMGVARGSSLALAGEDLAGEDAAVRLWNAGGPDGLRVRVRGLDLALAAERQVDASLTEMLAPGAALPVRLPPGDKRVELSLAPGVAAVAGWRGPDAVTVWAGGTALARTLSGAWTELLLVNTGPGPAPAALLAVPAPTNAALTGAGMLRRFEGAAGSFSLPLDAAPGQRLLVAGAEAIVIGRSGQVRRGNALALDGPGDLVLSHGPGLVAAWLEGGGAQPWPPVAPQDVDLPARLPLAGPAMALRLRQDAPVLLRVRSTAPVILSYGDGAPPGFYPAGAVAGRYLPAGEAMLRVLSPQDGPLTGTLALAATPVLDVREGLGETLALAPGGTALWGFRVAREGPIGLGVQAQPDAVQVRLLDETGRELAAGVSLLRNLRPGRYLLEASLPAGAATAVVRPAVYGLTPPPDSPPAELVRRLMVAAGLTPPG